MPTGKVKEALQQLPGFSRGVRSGAALRDVTVARPVCPNSQIRGKIVNGQYEPPEIGPEDVNCALEGGEWWVKCEAKGHNPYFMERKVYHTVDVEEEDPETGEVFVTGTKKKVVKVLTPNAVQVSPDIMHNSGFGLARKMKYLGFKRLKDLGFQEVCQFRGCQKPPVYRAPGLGDYCSLEHLNLIAAREAGERLTLTETQSLSNGVERDVKRKRERQLRETMPRDVEKIA